MKKYICNHIFGEEPDNVDTFGMISGLTLIGFLFGCFVYFFVFIPFFFIGT